MFNFCQVTVSIVLPGKNRETEIKKKGQRKEDDREIERERKKERKIERPSFVHCELKFFFILFFQAVA